MASSTVSPIRASGTPGCRVDMDESAADFFFTHPPSSSSSSIDPMTTPTFDSSTSLQQQQVMTTHSPTSLLPLQHSQLYHQSQSSDHHDWLSPKNQSSGGCGMTLSAGTGGNDLFTPIPSPASGGNGGVNPFSRHLLDSPRMSGSGGGAGSNSVGGFMTCSSSLQVSSSSNHRPYQSLQIWHNNNTMNNVTPFSSPRVGTAGGGSNSRNTSPANMFCSASLKNSSPTHQHSSSFFTNGGGPLVTEADHGGRHVSNQYLQSIPLSAGFSSMRPPPLMSSASGDMTIQFSDMQMQEDYSHSSQPHSDLICSPIVGHFESSSSASLQQPDDDHHSFISTTSYSSSVNSSSHSSPMNVPNQHQEPVQVTVKMKRPQAAVGLVVSELIQANHTVRRGSWPTIQSSRELNQQQQQQQQQSDLIKDGPSCNTQVARPIQSAVVAATVVSEPTTAVAAAPTIPRPSSSASKSRRGSISKTQSKSAVFESQSMQPPPTRINAPFSGVRICEKIHAISVSLPSSRSSSPAPTTDSPPPLTLKRSGSLQAKPRRIQPTRVRAAVNSTHTAHGPSTSSTAVKGKTVAAAGGEPDTVMEQKTQPIPPSQSNSSISSVSGSSSGSGSIAACGTRFRLECGSGPSHFEYNGLPILWRKASQRKDHPLVPTYIVRRKQQRMDANDGDRIADCDVNVKNASLSNFVLCDDEQNALFQLIQNEQRKRKPDVITNGVKLHAMYLLIDQQKIPFYYCSQKRITIEKAFASTRITRPCACHGQCLTTGLSHLQVELHRFLKSSDDQPLRASPNSSTSTTTRSSTLTQQYDRLLSELDDLKRQFQAHRRTLAPSSSTSSSSTTGAGHGRNHRKSSSVSSYKRPRTSTSTDSLHPVVRRQSTRVRPFKRKYVESEYEDEDEDEDGEEDEADEESMEEVRTKSNQNVKREVKKQDEDDLDEEYMEGEED